MEIKIIIDGNVVTPSLNAGVAAKDFASLPPIPEDYAKTEKISNLCKRFQTKGTVLEYGAEAGDITYSALVNRLPEFYNNFGNTEGLNKINIETR